MAYEAMANRDKLYKLEHWGEPVGAELSFLYIFIFKNPFMSTVLSFVPLSKEKLRQQAW